jgi:thioredoxin reductase (NADPH)
VNKPALLVVDDDAQVLAAVRRDLRPRYRQSYTIISAESGEQALATVRELKQRGDALALVLSDQRMPGMQGTDLLARTREIFPKAKRVLLTAYSDIDAAIKAINVAHLDHYLSKPWTPPEDCLFPVIDDLLDAWQADYLPETKGLRLVGHQWSPRSHEIKNFLAGNLIPYRWLDVARDPDTQSLLDAAGIASDALPALFFEDGTALGNPDQRQVAARVGRSQSAALQLYDLVIVGAGPAGLAAAVYGASEGLRTLLLDRHAPGGQAGSSSKIENYLGFPTGVSGTELARRALIQAQRLGAEFVIPLDVTGVSIDAGYKHVALKDGRTIVTRALVVATGMEYRAHPADGVAAHTGAGVYYGAATAEAPAFGDRRVLVIGGGNSAGQAAMHLSRFAKEVHIIVRRDSVRETMSHYLVEQIEKTPNIRLRTRSVLERVEGSDHVERVAITTDGRPLNVEDMDAVFVFIGTKPRTSWLPEIVLRDSKGFVLTGRDLTVDPRFGRTWKERREPMLLETSTPGLFAAGDVRSGSMNRVAAAVGEGSMAIRFVHEYLALT